MNKWLVAFFMLLFLSCKKQTPTIDAIEKTIDFSKVDTPPIFQGCKGLLNEAQDSCFKNTIQAVFSEELSKLSIKEKEIDNKNLTIILTFGKKGEISLQEKKFQNTFASTNLEFKKALEKSIKKLKVIYPATKQGIPVTTVYKLPIIIN